MNRVAMRKMTERLFGIKNKEQALNFKRKLSVLYAFIGWNAFGVGLYVIVNNQMPTDPAERRQAYSELSGTFNTVKVYQVTGLTLSQEFELLKQSRKKREVTEKENKANES